jgi:hypothetical protein
MVGKREMKKTLYTLIIMLASLTVAMEANASFINIAPTGTATASNSWLGAPGGPATPDKAIDENNNTGWNAGDSPVQWIEIDLGIDNEINQITGLVGQSPNGFTHHDVFLDGVLSFSWDGFTTNSQLLTHIFSSTVTAQVVRIQTTTSPSWVSWAEVQILTEINAAPLPSTILLVSFGLCALLIRLKRDYRKRNSAPVQPA